MEKPSGVHQSESHTDHIPDAEQVDLQTSPVTADEMEVERKAMEHAALEEAIVKDKQFAEEGKNALLEKFRIAAASKSPELRRQQEAIIIQRMKEAMYPERYSGQASSGAVEEGQFAGEPPAKTPEEGGGDGDDEHKPDHIILHEGQTDIKRKLCEKCHGTGRRLLLFSCPVCRGRGTIVESESTKWRDKLVERKPGGAEKPPASPQSTS
jgi:hypothetical protein